MIVALPEQPGHTEQPHADGAKDPPSKRLLAEDEDLENDGDHGKGRFDHGGDAGWHVLLGPEQRPVRRHDMVRAPIRMPRHSAVVGLALSPQSHESIERAARDEESDAAGEQGRSLEHGDPHREEGASQRT